MKYTVKCYYDPDGIMFDRWKVEVHTSTGVCKTISASTERRARAKARRYTKRRDRRVENHRGFV